jgi:hypothetical protein
MYHFVSTGRKGSASGEAGNRGCGYRRELAKHGCSPEANVTAVPSRGMRLGMLTTCLGERDAQPPATLFSIYAKLPMKWWAFGEQHRGLF